MTLTIAVLILGFAAWTYVAWKAMGNSEATLTTMALILIVLGIIGATFLAEVGIETPGAWAWFGTGIAMIAVQALRARKRAGR